MSWQAYVDSSLVGSGNVDKAAIFNVEGTSAWAASEGFKVEPAQIKDVVNSYTDKSVLERFYSNGFHIADSRYVVIMANERSLYGRKDKEGVVIVKTTQAILVAHYPETVQPGSAANTVEQLGDYLISVGY